MFVRPWQSEVPPFNKDVDLCVYYPCNDEDNGLVYVGWRGPPALSNRFDLIGCKTLLKYLSETSASPLQKEFVEIDNLFASNVKYSLIENSEPCLSLEFTNVPKLKISEISAHLNSIFNDIADKKIKINMQRLSTIIYRYILESLNSLESNPHSSISNIIIEDFIYGNNQEDVILTEINTTKNKIKIKLIL